MSNQAKQTPLADLLDAVPVKEVLRIHGEGPFPSYTNIPVGRLAHEAASELRRLHAEAEDFNGELSIATLALETQRKRIEELELAGRMASEALDYTYTVFGVTEQGKAAIAALSKALEGKE